MNICDNLKSQQRLKIKAFPVYKKFLRKCFKNILISIKPSDIVVYLVVTFLDNSNMASVEKLFEVPLNKKCMHASSTILHIYLLKLL